MKNTLIILCLLTMFSLQTLAQIGIGTTSPDVSAMLDVQSSARGLLAPRMTTYERTGIISPADGLLVYDTDSHSFWFYKNDVWSEFLGNTSGWSLSGNSLAGTEFLGSTNNQPVKFYSNNIERMRIDENGLIGINTSPVSGFRFTVNENSTNVSTSSIGISSRMNLNPAGNQTGFTWNMPLYTNLQITGNTNTMISVGSNTVVQNFSTGSASAQYGLIAQNEKHSNSSVGTLTGARTSAGVSNGTATDVIGGDFYTSASTSAAVTNLYAAKVSNYLGGSAMIGTLEGLDVLPAIPSGYAGTVTNAYGIRIRELTVGTNRVALAYDHPTSPFVVKGLGDVGIGTSSPSTRLHVVATSDPIRLEGLQTGTDTDVLVVDADGVVKKSSITGGNVWKINGNTISPAIVNNVVSIGNINVPDYALSVSNKQTDLAPGGGTLLLIDTSAVTSSGTYYSTGIRNRITPIIANGMTNSGAIYGVNQTFLRGDANDRGTLADLSGNVMHIGHLHTSSAPTTNKLYGYYTRVYNRSGLIDTAYAYYCMTDPYGTGTYQNLFGFYQSGSQMKNIFNGAVGIGAIDASTPTHQLHVKATSNPLRLEGLQTGTSTDVLVADATGVVQKRADLSGMKFGDATNYATFEADGTLVFNGTATTFNDFVVPLNTAKAGGNSPTWEKFRDNGSGSVGVFTWTFADVGTNSENEIHFTVQMPHGWKEGSTIEPHIHWAPMTNGSGVVRWGLEYTWVDYEGNFSNTTVVYGNSSAVSGNQYKHLITTFGPVTPSSSQDNISSVLMIRFFRNSGNAADTYPDKAAALSFDIHYETDMLGSRTEYSK